MAGPGFPYSFPFYIPAPPTPPNEIVEGITPQQNTGALAVSRLRQFLLASPGVALTNVGKVLQVFCNQTDDLEDAFQQLFYYRQLANAYGVMLDNTGVIVGLPRNGLPDPTYRLYLQAQILADNSGGTTADLNAIFSLIVPATVTFDLGWQYTAAFIIYLTDPNGVLTQTEINAFAQFMNTARAAGVGGVLEYSIGTPDADSFRFDVGPGFDTGLFRGAVRS